MSPHLIDTDLPLLRGVGVVPSEPCAVNFVGVKAHRRPGDKVHICVRCNFPIAVYGRLIPCEHVFCLTCAKLDPACFLCEERVTRIQKMDVLEGIYICGAPGCLRSFLARPDFDMHISDVHSQLLQLEQGRLSPERNPSVGNAAPKTQSQHADATPPVRQSSGTLQVVPPRKELQRKPSKGARQDPQGVLARPVPELRLPEQFPHYTRDQRSTHEQETNHANAFDSHGSDQKVRRHREWVMHAPQGQGEDERENYERQSQRGRRLDGGSSNHSGRKKEGEGDYRNPRSPLPTPKGLHERKEHQLSQQSNQQHPPPPPSYLPSFSPAYLPQQEGNSFPSRFEASRGFHSSMPFENGPQLRHPNGSIRPPEGHGHRGPARPMNRSSSQDQFGQIRPLQPQFYSEYGPAHGMAPMGHLPSPPPSGPFSKRTQFNGQRMDYSWGPGTPGSFGGPPHHHGYPN